MSWAKLDDEILDNGKIARAGALGLLLHIAGITWCARNLTDGRIPKHKVRCLLNLSGVYVDRGNSAGVPLSGDTDNGSIDHPDADGIAGHLEAVGLWHDCGDEWEIHDYLDYNPSREEVLARREHAREKKRRQRHDGECPPGTPPGTPPESPLESSLAVPIKARERDVSSFSSLLPNQTRARVKRAAPWPEGFLPEPQDRDYAARFGIAVGTEWENFRDHHVSRGNTFADWHAAWRTWVRNAVKFAKERQARGKRPPDSKPEAVAALARLGVANIGRSLTPDPVDREESRRRELAEQAKQLGVAR